MIFNVQRFSTHDGPGIRTVVFLKGCPLRCPWCENPESQSPRAELLYDERLCIGCLDCTRVGPSGAVQSRVAPPSGVHDSDTGARPVFHREMIPDPEIFRGVCPTDALTVVGEEPRIADILSEIEADRVFYGTDGGVTISGGEPFAQPDFVLELARELNTRKLNVAVETSLQTRWSVIEQSLPFISLFLADLKHTDARTYETTTGGRLEVVLDNFRRLESSGARVIVRIPVIPGFNDSRDELERMLDFASSLKNVEEVHLLPYHTLGSGKYHLLGRRDQMDGARMILPDNLLPLVEAARQKGLAASIGG